MDKVIEIEHLSKSFNSNQVLNDISMFVEKGETLVIMGKSGAGKTVLIKCIIGLMEADEGKLKVLGNDIGSLKKNDLTELRRKIGFLFQSSALYDSMTVEENLEFPFRTQQNTQMNLSRREREKKRSEKIEETLQHVGLANTRKLMPSELSGGMRKRIALARTLILKPELILYDEPTTGLDPITTREISELILSTQKKFNTTSIVITHDIECARIAGNRIIMLNEGSFVEKGTYEEIMKSHNEWVQSFFK